jgi:hypothetical protein
MMSRSRIVSVLALSALGAAGLLAAGSAAGAKVTKVKSTVKITSGEPTEFKGKVTSGNKKCLKGRKVKLFMESGSEDDLVGTAKTTASGAWEIHGSYLAGMYFARVEGMVIHTDSGRLNCLGGISVTHRY